MNKPEQRILDSNYELGGNSLLRQFSHWRRMNCSTMGYYSNGPGLKNMLILFIYHRLGKPIFIVHGWYYRQPRLQALVQRLRRLGRYTRF